MGKPKFKYERKQLPDGGGEVTRFEGGELHVELAFTEEDLMVRLEPCPFCGSTGLTLNNTHRAYYWITCDKCDAEVHGEPFGENVQKESVTLARHHEAKASAMAAWNRRA